MDKTKEKIKAGSKALNKIKIKEANGIEGVSAEIESMVDAVAAMADSEFRQECEDAYQKELEEIKKKPQFKKYFLPIAADYKIPVYFEWAKELIQLVLDSANHVDEYIFTALHEINKSIWNEREKHGIEHDYYYKDFYMPQIMSAKDLCEKTIGLINEYFECYKTDADEERRLMQVIDFCICEISSEHDSPGSSVLHEENFVSKSQN